MSYCRDKTYNIHIPSKTLTIYFQIVTKLLYPKCRLVDGQINISKINLNTEKNILATKMVSSSLVFITIYVHIPEIMKMS